MASRSTTPACRSSWSIDEAAIPPLLVRCLVENACAAARRETKSLFFLEGGNQSRLYVHVHRDSPAECDFSPALSRALQTLGKLACVGRSWRDAVSADSVDVALTRAITRDPPAWRGWTEGLSTAAAEDTSSFNLTASQVLTLLKQEDAFLAACRGSGMYEADVTLETHGKLLRPAVVFPTMTAAQERAVARAVVHPEEQGYGGDTMTTRVPHTRIGGYPDWPFHDEASCPKPPPKTPLVFIAQVNLSHAAGLLPNGTGLLPEDGMLYFFAQKDYLASINIQYLDPFFLRSIRCAVVYYPGPTADWPTETTTSPAFTTASGAGASSSSAGGGGSSLGVPALSRMLRGIEPPPPTSMTEEQKKKFSVPKNVSYVASTKATAVLTPPPVNLIELMSDRFNAIAGGTFDGSDFGSDYCSEAEGWIEEAYMAYAAKAEPDGKAPLMLGHCVPPPWMNDTLTLDEMRTKCYPDESDGVLPLLQFNLKSGTPNNDVRHYLVFTASKADLLARNFTRVKAYVQENIEM